MEPSEGCSFQQFLRRALSSVLAGAIYHTLGLMQAGTFRLQPTVASAGEPKNRQGTGGTEIAREEFNQFAEIIEWKGHVRVSDVCVKRRSQ
jgi:hypothetical protein